MIGLWVKRRESGVARMAHIPMEAQCFLCTRRQSNLEGCLDDDYQCFFC